MAEPFNLPWVPDLTGFLCLRSFTGKDQEAIILGIWGSFCYPNAISPFWEMHFFLPIFKFSEVL